MCRWSKCADPNVDHYVCDGGVFGAFEWDVTFQALHNGYVTSPTKTVDGAEAWFTLIPCRDQGVLRLLVSFRPPEAPPRVCVQKAGHTMCGFGPWPAIAWSCDRRV